MMIDTTKKSYSITKESEDALLVENLFKSLGDLSIPETKKNDCEILLDNVENVFGNLGECFESVLDERQTKMGVVKNIFRFGGSLTKLAFNTTTCAIKNTPKVIVAVAAVKRELVQSIEKEICEHRKQLKEEAMQEKIEQLSLKLSR